MRGNGIDMKLTMGSTEICNTSLSRSAILDCRAHQIEALLWCAWQTITGLHVQNIAVYMDQEG